MQQSIASYLRSWTLHTATAFVVGTIILAYYTCHFYACTRRIIHPIYHKALKATRSQIARLWVELARGAIQAAILLVVCTVVFAFYAILYGTRCMRVLRARLHKIGEILQQTGSALLGYLKGARAAVLLPARVFTGSFGRFSQLLLFGAFFSLALTPPMQVKTPVSILPHTQKNEIVPVPSATVPYTPTDRPTATVTNTPIPTPTVTPTVHITAVAQLARARKLRRSRRGHGHGTVHLAVCPEIALRIQL